MGKVPELNGPRFGCAPGHARGLVVLLHGLGADGNDLISLAPALAQALPELAFVAPNAPFRCDMAPVGLQWFSFRSTRAEDVLAGVLRAAPILDAFIDVQLERYGLPDQGLALLGFSQGAMMALYVGLRRARPCAAILSYSGALIAPELLPGEIRSRPPVLLVHGAADPVVPFEALGAGEAALATSGVTVRAEARPGLGHGIDEVGLDLGRGLLEQAFAARGPADEAAPGAAR